MMTHDQLKLLPSAEQVGIWRKALADTDDIKLAPDGSGGHMMVSNTIGAHGERLADLYNWLALLDAALAEVASVRPN